MSNDSTQAENDSVLIFSEEGRTGSYRQNRFSPGRLRRKLPEVQRTTAPGPRHCPRYVTRSQISPEGVSWQATSSEVEQRLT